MKAEYVKVGDKKKREEDMRGGGIGERGRKERWFAQGKKKSKSKERSKKQEEEKIKLNSCP